MRDVRDISLRVGEQDLLLVDDAIFWVRLHDDLLQHLFVVRQMVCADREFWRELGERIARAAQEVALEASMSDLMKSTRLMALSRTKSSSVVVAMCSTASFPSDASVRNVLPPLLPDR